MERHTIIALRLACMAGGFVGISCLYACTLGTAGGVSVFDTVYAHSVLILIALLYYGFAKLCVGACSRAKPRLRRVSLVPRDADGNYVDIHLTTATELIAGAPKLTIQNVWILVYGVGYILFVSGYCILGLNRVCLASLGFGMLTLAVDELVCPRVAMGKLYISARASVVVCGFVSLFLVTSQLMSDEFLISVTSLDLYSIVFGLLLPNVAQFLMVTVRDCRRFSLGTVVEVCEFGLPFTAFLGVFHLSVAYGQRFQIASEGPVIGYDAFLNQSWYRDALLSAHLRTDWAVLLFYAIAPILVTPVLLGYISCVLEGCAIDPFLSVCLALCVHYLIEKPASALGIYGTLCCALATLIRILAEFHPRLNPLSAGPSSENTQLNQHVVWQRTRAAEEMTRDLESEPDTASSGL
jgi:hypothetical protein